MANALYGKGRQKFGEAGIDWVSDNIKMVLIDVADYTVSINVDEFLSDIPGAAIVSTSANLTGKSNVLGVMDAADFTFTSVSGDPSEAIVAYKDTGSAATSPLIAYIDTATGLPVTPNGGDINIIIDSGSNKLFKL